MGPTFGMDFLYVTNYFTLRVIYVLGAYVKKFPKIYFILAIM